MKKLSLILLTSLMAVPLAHASSSQLNLGALVDKAQQSQQSQVRQRKQTTPPAASAATPTPAAPIQASQPQAITASAATAAAALASGSAVLSTSPSNGLGLATKKQANSATAAAGAAQVKPSQADVKAEATTTEDKNPNIQEKTQTLILNSMKNTNKGNYHSRLKDAEKTSSFVNHVKNFNQEELKQALTLRPYCPSNTEIQEGKARIQQITGALSQNNLTYKKYNGHRTTTHKRSDVFGKLNDPYATETESGSSRPALGSSILDGYLLSLDQIAKENLETHRTDTITLALGILEKLANPRLIQAFNAPELSRLKGEIERLKGVIFSQNTSEASKEAAKRELEKTTREYAGLLGREKAAAQERDLKHNLIFEMRNQTLTGYWLMSDKVKRFLPSIYTLAREQLQQKARIKLQELISKLEQDEQQPKAQSVVITTEKRFGKPCTPWFLDLRAKEPKKAILTAESNTDTLYDLSRIGEAPEKLSDVYKKRLEPTQETQEYATWKKERNTAIAKRTLAAAAAGSTEIVPKQ